MSLWEFCDLTNEICQILTWNQQIHQSSWSSLSLLVLLTGIFTSLYLVLCPIFDLWPLLGPPQARDVEDGFYFLLRQNAEE